MWLLLPHRREVQHEHNRTKNRHPEAIYPKLLTHEIRLDMSDNGENKVSKYADGDSGCNRRVIQNGSDDQAKRGQRLNSDKRPPPILRKIDSAKAATNELGWLHRKHGIADQNDG